MTAVAENIEEMLETLREERAQLEQRLKVLAQREQTLLAWRDEQVALASQQPQLISAPPAIDAAPLSTYLYSVLADGKPRDLERLAQLAAERHLVNGDAPGRRVHFALVGLSKRGFVHRNKKDRTWVIAAS